MAHRTGRRKPGEELWYLASIALLGGAEDWWFLIGKAGFVEGHKPGKAPVDDEVFHGHLAHAKQRFPNEPRFALASAVSIESLSWEVGGFGRDPNRRGIVAGEIAPEALARADKDRVELLPTATGTPTRRFVNGGPGIPEVKGVARKYAALASEAPIAAEAHIRAGLVSYRIADNEAAIGHLLQVPKLTDDPFLVHLSHLIEGIVRERQGQDEAAITAYRAALTRDASCADGDDDAGDAADEDRAHQRGRAGCRELFRRWAAGRGSLAALPARRLSILARADDPAPGGIPMTQPRSCGIVTVVLFGARVARRRAAQEPRQAFHAATDVVSVNVSVRSGRTPVTGLSAADFVLLDNGVRQEITAVSVEQVPLDLTLLLDTSPSTADAINKFKSGAQEITTLLREQDQVRLVTFATDVIEIFPVPSRRRADAGRRSDAAGRHVAP